MPAIVSQRRAQSHPGLRIVVNDQYRGTLPRGKFGVGNEQQRIHHFAAERNLHSKLMLNNVLPVDRVHHFHARILDERRPGTHELMPRRQNFLPAPFPVRGITNGRAIRKRQRRTEVAEIRTILFWRREELGQCGGRRLREELDVLEPSRLLLARGQLVVGRPGVAGTSEEQSNRQEKRPGSSIGAHGQHFCFL